MIGRVHREPDGLYPRYLPADLYRHYLLIAMVASGVVLGAVPTVTVLAHLPMTWPVLWGGVAVSATAAMTSTWLVCGPLARRRAGIAVLYIWSLLDIGVLGAVVATSGGARSWFWIVFVLMTVFFSIGFPMRGQLLVLAGTLVTYALACVVGTVSLGVVNMTWKLGAILAVFATASFPALELRRQMAEHQRARHHADALSAALVRREEWWRSLIERTSDPIMVFDPTWRVTFASPAFEKLLGYSNEESATMDLGSMVHPDDLELVRLVSSSIRPDTPSRMTARLQGKDGVWHDVEISIVQVHGDGEESSGTAMAEDRSSIGPRGWNARTGRNDAFVVNFHDVTERVTAQVALRHQATHDALTGLANRRAFYDALRSSIAAAAQSVSVLVLDLEKFKRVNDTVGHAAGDSLLVEVGRRLVATLPRAEIVARLGGDEFAAVLSEDGDPDGAVAAARRVLGALDEPVELGDRPYWLRGSVGVACSLRNGVMPEELMQRADRAMHEAKRTGVGVAIYDRRMDGTDSARFGLLGELRRAIQQEELRLVYQPKVSPHDGLVGVEALVRWQHPQLGLLPPAVFLPMAEDSGLVRALTAWVFPTALRQLSVWEAAGRDLSVSVNVSAQDLSDDQFPSLLEEWLAEAAVDPERLVLELTESSAISDYDRGTGTLAKLRGLGVRVSLDDFGTGYSSLAYLAQLPLDEIKLDRGFLQSGLGTGSFLLRSIVEIGQHLGLTVVAEGVETEAVLDQVLSCGCDQVQGYVYAKPQPPEEIDRLFDRWQPERHRLPEPPADGEDVLAGPRVG